MNPVALFLLVMGTGCFAGGAMTGTFNGASILGVLFVLASLAVQTVWPRDRKPPVIYPESHPGTLSELDIRDGVGSRTVPVQVDPEEWNVWGPVEPPDTER